MRAAERNDYIRRLSTARGKWGRYISTLSIMSFKGIENLNIDFVPNINIIVGANGTGKSRVLEAVRDSLDNEDLTNIRLSGSSDLRSGRSATLVSSGRLTEIYKPYFQTLPDVGEALLTGLSPMECLAPELEEINYLLCRSYSAVKVYEVEPGLRVATSDDTDNTFSEETVPFFVVTRSGYEYSTVDMGSGEYAALYMWWSLHRSENNDLFIFEEPESYLSYKVQDRLADLFAKYSWNKCLFMIISTHSYPFISKFPADGVCALLMSGKNVAKSSRGKTEILSQIGAGQRIDCWVITEDISSEFCVNYILSHFLPEIHTRIMVAAMTGCGPQAKSGASAVSALLEASRHANKNPIKFIGVFDNDQEFEPTFTDRRIEMTRKMILSNNEPFDQILTNVARSNIDRIEEKLSGFSALFFEHEGLNYHDHLIKVAQLMAIDVRLIWRFCLDIWIDSNREDCEKLAKQIEDLTLV